MNNLLNRDQSGTVLKTGVKMLNLSWCIK